MRLEADITEAQQRARSEEHTSELQSRQYLVCRLLLEKKTKKEKTQYRGTHIQSTAPQVSNGARTRYVLRVSSWRCRSLPRGLSFVSFFFFFKMSRPPKISPFFPPPPPSH